MTSSVLTSLSSPSIIDFGGGHSIYEDYIMFSKMKELISKFKNVILMLPSENIEESLQILNERLSKRDKNYGLQQYNTNNHFLKMPCNYELATNIIYTGNLDVETISEMIVSEINRTRKTR